MIKRNDSQLNLKFKYCDSMVDLSNFDTQNVAYMGYMFYRCKSLKEVNLSSFNINKVQNMNGMFNLCELEFKSKIREEYDNFYDEAFK